MEYCAMPIDDAALRCLFADHEVAQASADNAKRVLEQYAMAYLERLRTCQRGNGAVTPLPPRPTPEHIAAVDVARTMADRAGDLKVEILGATPATLTGLAGKAQWLLDNIHGDDHGTRIARALACNVIFLLA
jgi:hypothetical protein